MAYTYEPESIFFRAHIKSGERVVCVFTKAPSEYELKLMLEALNNGRS